ncbi:ABC transporter substrate-binding protein [Nocardioides caeni]|uniref:ABC transporter substrate-binding protein n=1 Tax=Nocardioides caeni TaxID=574700 RepID=A0A4V4HLG5_9ACTN|nr:ABC transporter substrate-binding protein [Nocardioides caeni]THV18166.1 ABC transporter substrate-binding protein [Nocardioides caeni]
MNRIRTLALVASAVAVLTSCGLVAEGDATSGGSPAAGYPVTIDNCGAEVTFDAAPEQVVLLKSSAVPFLAALDVLDTVTARAGEYPRDYYGDATWAALEQIPALTGKTDTSGHLLISKEVVIGEEPDLVLGEVDNLSRDTLDDVGIPLIEEPAMCAEGLEGPGFDDVHAQMTTYGEVFGRTEEAVAANAALEERLTELGSRVSPGEERTAAVLYPTVGGGVTYAYGTRSMAHPILEAAGFENVFADTDERVFEVTREDLIGRDPDVLVLLHSGGDPADVEEAVTSLPGVESITAVADGNLLPLLFNYVEPPTPLALDGLEQILERFGSGG